MYGTVAGVKGLTGVKPEHLDLPTDADLDAQVTGWLEDATSMIDEYLERDLQAEVAAGQLVAIPRTVHNGAERIVVNMVTLAMQRRASPVVQVGEFTIQLSSDAVFTKAIKDDLYPLHRKNKRRQPRISLAGFPDE